MSDRKFYKTVVCVTVLSEDEPWSGDLSWLSYDVTEGDCVGAGVDVSSEEVTAERMVTLLEEAGSDPSFFDIEEEEPSTKKTIVITAEGEE